MQLVLGPQLSWKDDYPYLLPWDPIDCKREWFWAPPDGRTYYVPKTKFDKQGSVKTYFGNTMYCGDKEVSHAQSDVNKFFNDSGDYVTWRDHFKGDGSYHSYNVTYGFHSETQNKVHYSGERIIGCEFELNLEGDDAARAKESFSINEIIFHYTDTAYNSKFKNLGIYPGGTSGGTYQGITFRNSYDRSSSRDVSFNQFKSNWTKVWAWTKNKDILYSSWDWCGFSISFWISGGYTSDIYYKPRIRRLTPITTHRNIKTSDKNNHKGLFRPVWLSPRRHEDRSSSQHYLMI